MSRWIAKLEDGSIVQEPETDWAYLDKTKVKVLYLVAGDQTLTLQKLGYFFQYKSSSVHMGAVGIPGKKEMLYQTIGTTYNDDGDCIVIMATADGDVLIGKDNVHNMRTFDDTVGHINFKLQGIGLECNYD